MKDKKVIEVKNIAGTPIHVENTVNYHLKNGYVLGSELIKWSRSDPRQEIFVQQVILYEGE